MELFPPAGRGRITTRPLLCSRSNPVQRRLFPKGKGIFHQSRGDARLQLARPVERGVLRIRRVARVTYRVTVTTGDRPLGTISNFVEERARFA
jgi:hypothetical protein